MAYIVRLRGLLSDDWVDYGRKESLEQAKQAATRLLNETETKGVRIHEDNPEFKKVFEEVR